MSPEVEKYYENYFLLFSTPEWKQFVSDINVVLKQAIETTHKCENSEAFHERKGLIYAYTYITNIEQVIENNYNQVKMDDEAGDVDNEENV